MNNNTDEWTFVSSNKRNTKNNDIMTNNTTNIVDKNVINTNENVVDTISNMNIDNTREVVLATKTKCGNQRITQRAALGEVFAGYVSNQTSDDYSDDHNESHDNATHSLNNKYRYRPYNNNYHNKHRPYNNNYHYNNNNNGYNNYRKYNSNNNNLY